MQETKKSKLKLKVTLPFLASQKLDSPYVSCIRVQLRLFKVFSRTIIIPYKFDMIAAKSHCSLKKVAHLKLLLRMNHKRLQQRYLLDQLFIN